MKKLLVGLILILSLNVLGDIDDFVDVIRKIGMTTYGLETSDEDTVIKLLELIRDDGIENVPTYTNDSMPSNIIPVSLDGSHSSGFSSAFISDLNADIIDVLGDNSRVLADLYIQPILYTGNITKMFEDTRENAVSSANGFLSNYYESILVVEAQKVTKIEMGITYNELVGYVYVIAIFIDTDAISEEEN